MSKAIRSISDIEWLYPSLLKVYKTAVSDREPITYVFANGQQRAEVKVEVELVAADGFTVVPISVTELRKMIRLVAYGEVSDANCIPVDDEQIGLATWTSSFSENEYTWNEEFIKRTLPSSSEHAHGKVIDSPHLFHSPAVDAAPQSNAADPHGDDDIPRNRNTLKFFVSGSSVASLKIAARLKTLGTHPLVFHTGSPQADDPDGRGQNGAFNSSVELRCVRPYTPSASREEFGDKDPNNAVRLSRNLVKSSAPMHFYEQWITMRFLGESIKPLKATMGDQPNLWQDGARADGLQWSIFLIAPPNARTYSVSDTYELRTPAGVKKGSIKDNVALITKNDIANTSPYRVVVGQLSGTDDWRVTGRDGQAPGDLRNTPLKITDEFGTEHKLRLSIDNLAWCRIDDDYERVDGNGANAPSAVPDYNGYLVSPKITIYQDRLYANGRQTSTIEIGFTVSITVFDDKGNKKKINRKPTQNELNSVRLFDYKYGHPLVYTDDIIESGWSSTGGTRPFDIHPDAKPTGIAPLDDDIGYVRIYVSGGLDTVNQIIDLGFIATLGDYMFWTNGNVYDRSGNFVEKNEGIDTRPGRTVASLPPVIYPVDRFQFNDKPRDAPSFDQELELSININRPDPLGIHSVTCVPDGVIHWDKPGSASRNPCFIGYVPPGEVNVRHDKIISSTLAQYGIGPKWHIDYARQQRVVILLGGRMGISIDEFDKSNPPPVGSATLRMIDMHGTTQVRSILFVPNSRNNLIIV